jgi:hypothetical protein
MGMGSSSVDGDEFGFEQELAFGGRQQHVPALTALVESFGGDLPSLPAAKRCQNGFRVLF